MNVLEKILEEIKEVEKEYVTGHKVLYALGATGMATEISNIIRSNMENYKVNELDKKPVLEMNVIHHESYDLGRNIGWNECLECLEAIQINRDDNWIPVEENQLEVRYDVFLSKETEGLTIDKEIRLDHKPTREELKTLISTHKMKAAWYMKRYCYNPCKGCFGAANNDCGKCEYGGGSSE